MEVLDIKTPFALVLFHGAKAHYCPSQLVSSLLIDLEERNMLFKEIIEVDKGGLDLPGMCMRDRPWEDMMIGDFKFSVPSQDFEIILDELQTVHLRKFHDGQEYFKIHGWVHCLVMTPAQYETLIVEMLRRLPEVKETAKKWDEEFSRRLAEVNKSLDGKAKVVSSRDKNSPNVIRIPKPLKYNN